ncbi:MAG: hypothetical protein CSB47_09930 [Proteobacteria bacterium]|nr:MAG: hypothetical protein CSB47_09930 [Pseudomonadota bacterium]
MFKKFAITAVSITALVMSAQASAARYSSSEIDQQQKEQAVMIAQGIKTGMLTPSEAKQLKTQQQTIAALEKKYRANGLQSWELKTLSSKLHEARIQINKLTKNNVNCKGQADGRRRQPVVIGRCDGSRQPRTTDGRGTKGVVIGR